MDGHKYSEPLTDSALDRELEAALGVEPSPEFLAKVRARVASERIGEAWYVPSWRWAFAVCATAIVAAVGVFVLRGSAPPPSSHVTLAPLRDPVVSTPQAAASVVPPVAPALAGETRQRRSRRVPAPARVEVVVSHDDAAALSQLASVVASRQVRPSTWPDLAPVDGPLPTMEEIVLEPITLSPLARIDSEEGVRQ